ncbi:hypothetical protein K7432_015849 [Basidiobolus ranarum]|uniref:LOV domain-containing protein n=1 Tax=Basidiobolus ranarum TaxID=34480 RepID=A0ABR2VMP4_9FUNG
MVKERTKELITSEMRYKSLTKLSPVGIFRLDLDGRVTYTNEKWWKISGHNRELDPTASDFLSSVHPEDRESSNLLWQHAIREKLDCIVEFRWRWPNGESRWCLNEMIVQYDEDKKPCGFVGAISDLTERKILEKERLSAVRLAEQQQRHRAEEAEEVKRQQEIYIDMTCHELRNPLNGIYHSADLLHESLEKVQKEVRKESIKKVANWLENEITSDLDVIDTITLCAQHQKKIADDVLHMSKINMNLLVLSKTNMRPVSVVSNVIRMFETEVRLKEIDLEFTVAEGYSQLDVDWVKGDPTRFTQILINFLTNAIRFTERAPFRRITVTLDALDQPPQSTVNEIVEINEQQLCIRNGGDGEHSSVLISSNPQSETQTEFGSPVIGSDVTSDISDNMGGEPSEGPTTALLDAVYIAISIKDSGVGMTIEEQSNLFQRFAQANPRTYAEFGGSGLGLFISKRLVELHDGKITVESKKGDGTTFSFYIKCERIDNSMSPEQLGLDIDTGVMEYTYTEPHKPPIDRLSTKGSPITKEAHKRKSSSVKQKGKLKKQIGNKCKLPKEKEDSVVWTKSCEIEHTAELILDADGTTPHTMECSLGPDTDVLVVEDNLINQRVLKRQLESAGFSVGVAKHGVEALDVITESNYHLILMDLEMPIMGGLECTRRIREIEQENGGRYIPIIGVSGNAREEYRRLAIESGMTDYIIKPYDKQELMDLVLGYIQKFN